MPAKKLSLVKIILFYSLFVFLIHPKIILHLSTHIIGGSQVGGLFVWEFWWFKKALYSAGELNPFYSKYLLYPIGTFIFQAPLLLGLSLFLQLFTNVYMTYNLLNFVAYIGSGVTMFTLTRTLTNDDASSLLSGSFFMFSHYALMQHTLGHLNESFILFVPLFFLGLLQMSQRINNRSKALFLIGVLGIVLSSTYLPFSVFILGCPFFLLGLWSQNKGILKKRFLQNVALMLLIGGLVGGLFYWTILYHKADLTGGSEMSSLSLLSFLDYPIWHGNQHVQKLRQFTSGFVDSSLINAPYYLGRPEHILKAKPEEIMGFPIG